MLHWSALPLFAFLLLCWVCGSASEEKAESGSPFVILSACDGRPQYYEFQGWTLDASGGDFVLRNMSEETVQELSIVGGTHSCRRIGDEVQCFSEHALVDHHEVPPGTYSLFPKKNVLDHLLCPVVVEEFDVDDCPFKREIEIAAEKKEGILGNLFSFNFSAPDISLLGLFKYSVCGSKGRCRPFSFYVYPPRVEAVESSYRPGKDDSPGPTEMRDFLHSHFTATALPKFELKKCEGDVDCDVEGRATPYCDSMGVCSDSPLHCFVATASFGSPLDSRIDTLRVFRDSVLLRGHFAPFGRMMVKAYYGASPAVARVISTRRWIRAGVRGVLWPIVWFLEAAGVGEL